MDRIQDATRGTHVTRQIEARHVVILGRVAGGSTGPVNGRVSPLSIRQGLEKQVFVWCVCLVQLEEMRGCYEERLKALKQDLERRAKMV